MDVFIPFVFLTVFISNVYPTSWTSTLNDFLKETSSITNFFEQQSHKVKDFVTNSYNDVVKTKESVQNYVKQKKRIMRSNYTRGVNNNGRNVALTWSFVPDDDTASLLNNPDVVLTVPSIIAKHGYICETHTIISQGYVLNIHRIPHSRHSDVIPSKTVFLQHGLFASSADWIINGPGKGLAYVLSDAGYDVWMANIRGNKYSKDHILYQSNSKPYWNFSWHDVALYDVPEIIDYIIKTKGDTKITYIGHSMGTTILFAMLTIRPEYNQVLTAGFALAPVVFLSNMKSPLKSLMPIASDLASIDMMQSVYEFIPKNSALGKIVYPCNTQYVDTLICKNVVFYLCGFNEKQFNRTLLPVFLSHIGTGTSWKTAIHFSQEILSDSKFQYFDYGYSYNRKIYGTRQPPEYDLSKISLPLKLFWSKNDLLSSEQDVLTLYERLPSKPDMFLVPDDEFNHLDYIWAIDAPKLLNNEILASLNKYMQ